MQELLLPLHVASNLFLLRGTVKIHERNCWDVIASESGQSFRKRPRTVTLDDIKMERLHLTHVENKKMLDNRREETPGIDAKWCVCVCVLLQRFVFQFHMGFAICSLGQIPRLILIPNWCGTNTVLPRQRCYIIRNTPNTEHIRILLSPVQTIHTSKQQNW